MNAMKELVGKLQKVECRISRERGPFVLFALFQLPDSGNYWDLLIAAPWAHESDLETIRYMVEELRKDLTFEERRTIERIMIIPSDFEDLEELYQEHPVEHGKVIVRNREFGLQTVVKGYVITCRPPVAKAA